LGSYTLILYVVAFGAIFYFMAIRPQSRQRKAHAELLSALKKGDQVLTAGGLYGTVKRIDEGIVVVEIARGVTIKIARRAITEVIRDSTKARAAAPEGTARRGRQDVPEIEDETSDEDYADSGEASSDPGNSPEVTHEAPQADSVFPKLRGRTKKPQ